MKHDKLTIYAADWVLPVNAAPIRRGALAMAGGRIVAVGPADEMRLAHGDASFEDLGQSIIMPGFINAHSHLEYTTFRGILDDEEFSDWILQLVDVKASL